MELPQAPGADEGSQPSGFNAAAPSSRRRDLVLPPPPTSPSSVPPGPRVPRLFQHRVSSPRCLGTILIEPSAKVYPSQFPGPRNAATTPKRKSLFASWFGEQTQSAAKGDRDLCGRAESKCLTGGAGGRDDGDPLSRRESTASAYSVREESSRQRSGCSLPWASYSPPPASLQSEKSFFSALPPEAVARARTPPPSRQRDPALQQQKPRRNSFTQSAKTASPVLHGAVGFAAPGTAFPVPCGRPRLVALPLPDKGTSANVIRTRSPDWRPPAFRIMEESGVTDNYPNVSGGAGGREREPLVGREGIGTAEAAPAIGLPMRRGFPSPSIRVYGGIQSVLGPDDPVPSPRLRSEPASRLSCDSRPPSEGQCFSSGCSQGSSRRGPSANHGFTGYTLGSALRPPDLEASGFMKGEAVRRDGRTADYSRAQTSQKVLEQKMVNEGYDKFECIVPRLRPVSVVEKRVEVPVVKTVDTIVPRPRIEERIKFVDKPIFQEVEKFVEVPEVFYNDIIVEVPEIIEVIKRVPKEEIHENITYVPKFETKIIPKYVEVPIIKVVDRYEEVQEVHEVLKPVPKVTVVDVPREVVRIVPSYVVHKTKKEVPVPVIEYKQVPRYKTKYEPKIIHNVTVNHVPEYHDIEVPYELPRVKVVEQPYFVTKYRDRHYPVTVSQSVTPVLRPGHHTQVVDVSVQQPYIVTHDRAYQSFFTALRYAIKTKTQHTVRFSQQYTFERHLLECLRAARLAQAASSRVIG